MKISLKGLVNGKNENLLNIFELPDICPYCHNGIQPVPLFGSYTKITGWSVFMFCPHSKCNMSFVAFYRADAVNISQALYTNKTSFGSIEGKKFPDEINNISPAFTKIYNESYGAEQ